MKITIENDQTTTVYETNDVSTFESFQYLNKLFNIVAINGRYDWKDHILDGLYPTWPLVRPLIGDPIGGSTVCLSPVKAENFVTAMPQADGMGDDSEFRKGSTRYDPTGVEDDDIPF